MAIYALTSQVVTIATVDYSDHLKSATLTVDAAQLDTTDCASGGWVEMIGGLKSGTLSLEFMDDVADNDVDEELWARLGTVASTRVKRRPRRLCHARHCHLKDPGGGGH